MHNKPKKKKKKFNAKSTRHWHRYLGFIVSGFALILSFTGIMLNHTEYFNLDSRYVNSDKILNIYGIKFPHHPVGYKINGKWITKVERNLFVSSANVYESDEPLIGAVLIDDLIVVAFTQSVLLLNKQLEIVELIGPESGIPKDIVKIGLGKQNDVIILTPESNYKTDKDFLTWQQTESSDVEWSTQQKIPDTLYNEIKNIYRGEGLPLERVILDLHSGRFFGKVGVYVWDAAGVIILVLALSGIFLFYFPAGFRKRQK